MNSSEYCYATGPWDRLVFKWQRTGLGGEHHKLTETVENKEGSNLGTMDERMKKS